MANVLYKEGKKRSTKKIVIVIVCIVVFLLAVLMFIGITAGGMRDEKEQISAAVQENVQLKQMIDNLNTQIEEQQAKIDELQLQLDSRPTEPPLQEPAPEQNDKQSPRGGRE